MMETSNATILDVRSDAEFRDAHIEGAILIPEPMIAEMAPELLPDRKQIILVYCRSGVRSERACSGIGNGVTGNKDLY